MANHQAFLMHCGLFNWSHPDVFSLNIPRVSSVKTQLIYCQLKWRHVSTHGVIIRPIIETCLRGTSSKSAHFWGPKMFTTVREHGYK